MSSTSVVVHPDAALLAQTVAARLVTRLVDVQNARGDAHIVLTGGGAGTAVLRELARIPARDAVDWRRLSLWWGDERFLPAGHPDRNETQARAALLDHVPVDPTRVHAIDAAEELAPAVGGHGGPVADPEAAAERYADALARAARPEDHGDVPNFDVLLLGIGEEGHVASIFPESPAAYDERAVVAVHGCPKPPPTRISMTFATIGRAREVWVLASGEAKADAVGLALGGAGRVQVPAAGVAGTSRTLWLVDQVAAARLPASLRHPR